MPLEPQRVQVPPVRVVSGIGYELDPADAAERLRGAADEHRVSVVTVC